MKLFAIIIFLFTYINCTSQTIATADTIKGRLVFSVHASNDTVSVWLLVGDTKHDYRIGDEYHTVESGLQKLTFMRSGYEIRSSTGAHISFLNTNKKPLEKRYIVWDSKIKEGREQRKSLRYEYNANK